MTTPKSRAWYRQPIMWLVVGVPLSAVLFGIVMISLAVTGADGLVVDDYYKRGLEINRSLERDRFAAQLGLEARVTLEPDRHQVLVDLSWPAPDSRPERVELSFLHATRQDEDRRIVLRGDGHGRYSGDLPVLVAGRWYVRVATDRWRLQSAVNLPLPPGSPLLLLPEKVPGRGDAG